MADDTKEDDKIHVGFNPEEAKIELEFEIQCLKTVPKKDTENKKKK